MLDIHTAAIATHVILGVIAVTMGAIALAVRKGSKPHVGVGRVFVLSMGLASLLGAALGLAKYETLFITFHAGVLGTTLVVSGVLAARIHRHHVKRAFAIVASVNVLNAFGLLAAGLYATTLADNRLFGFEATDYVFLFGMATIAFLSDLAVLTRAQITDRHRIAQHLWRMCIGFFIAAGSAFTGPGASAFPDAIQASGLLSLPELVIIILMLFWLYKTLRQRQSGSKPVTDPNVQGVGDNV